MKISVDFTRKPTEKMIAYAESLSDKTPVKLTGDVYENYDACSAYITKCKDYIEEFGYEKPEDDNEKDYLSRYGFDDNN